MDPKAALQQAKDRFGYILPNMCPAFVVFSERFEPLLEMLDVPLSKREIRVVSEYNGGVFKRFFPSILDNGPTLTGLIRRPTAFAMALRVLMGSRHGRAKSRVRELMIPFFGPDADPAFEGIGSLMTSKEYDGSGFAEHLATLAKVAATSHPDIALVALLAIAMHSQPLDHIDTLDEAIAGDEDVLAIRANRNHAVGVFAAYLFGTQLKLLGNPHKTEKRRALAEKLVTHLDRKRTESISRKLFPDNRFEQLVSDPSYYRKLEDELNDGTVKTFRDFGERKNLFSALSSRSERRDFVSTISEISLLSKSSPIEDAARETLHSLVNGYVGIHAMHATELFLKWYATYAPQSAYEMACQIDRETYSEAASTYMLSQICSEIDDGEPRRRPNRILPVSPVRTQSDPSPTEPNTARPIERAEPIPVEPTIDPKEMNHPVVGREGERLTAEAMTAIERWADGKASLTDLASRPSIDITDPSCARSYLDDIEREIASLRITLASFDQATRPVVVDDLLRRIGDVNSAIADASELAPHVVPESGTVLPHQFDDLTGKVREGEHASQEMRASMAIATDAHGRLASSPLSSRSDLIDLFSRTSREALRWSGVAWSAIEASLRLVTPRAAEVRPEIALAERQSDTFEEPGEAVEILPASGPQSTAPLLERHSGRADRVRQVVARSGLAAGLLAARRDGKAELGDLSPVVLEAIMTPGKVEPDRFYEADVRDIFELAHLQLLEVDAAERSAITGLLSIASLEGATFAPGTIYTEILEDAEGGRTGAIAHRLLRPISDLVQRTGVPSPESFLEVRRFDERAERSRILSEKIMVAIDVTRTAHNSNRAADQLRDDLCASEGLFGRIGHAVASSDYPNDLTGTALRLASEDEASRLIDDIVRKVGVDRLFSTARTKVRDTIVHVAGMFLELTRLTSANDELDGAYGRLAKAADEAVSSILPILEAEKDPFERACLQRAEVILRRYSSLTNGHGDDRVA